jgi:hypothetical protein
MDTIGASAKSVFLKTTGTDLLGHALGVAAVNVIQRGEWRSRALANGRLVLASIAKVGLISDEPDRALSDGVRLRASVKTALMPKSFVLKCSAQSPGRISRLLAVFFCSSVRVA